MTPTPKVALITGGSSGLGLSLAEKLGRQNYRVILLARGPERLDSAVAYLKVLRIQALAFACDVTDEAGLARIAETVRADYGAIDFLITSAGAVTPKLFSDYADSASLRRELDVNLWGTVLPVYHFLPLLTSGSKILMIASGFGLMGAAGYAMYCAGKAGVVNFAAALRRELLHRNIAVYAACPSDIDTPMLHEEIKRAPAWMKKDSPRKVASADTVAARILKQVRGTRRSLIVPAADVGMLMLLMKLPRLWLDAILDRMFPIP